MTTEMNATQELQGPDEFDLLLNDVLRTVANPEMPERVRVNVRTRVWVREMGVVRKPTSDEGPSEMGHPTVVPPAVFQDFQARMNPKRSMASTMWALGLHAAAIVLIFWMVAAKVHSVSLVKTAEMTELTPPPPMAPLKKDMMGGGGGQKSPTPVSKGQLPKFAETQITPPKAPPLEEPKIRMPDPTIEVQKDLRMTNNNMPNMGMPNSPLLGNSMGNGSGTGIGSGNGSGLGPGSGGNYGGGPKRIGGGVSAPQLVFQVDPEFSEEARKAKFMGVVTVNLWVDENGNPTHVRVARGVGMGLDQKAVDAVKQYKFKPAMEGGKPVTVELNIEVNFQIF
jgi:periplasmic protein TonB